MRGAKGGDFYTPDPTRLVVRGFERWDGESLVHFMHRLAIQGGDLPPGMPYPDADELPGREPGEEG